MPVETARVPLDSRTGRTLDVAIRNNFPEIRNFVLEASGDGFRFLPARTDVSIAPAEERVVSLRVFPQTAGSGPGHTAAPEAARDAPAARRPALLRLSGGAQAELSFELLVIPRGGAMAWEADLDGDGAPEWVVENQKLRAVFSLQDGGRWLEFLWKDTELNLAPEGGALAGEGLVNVQAEGGRLEFSGSGWKRAVSLEENRLILDQTPHLPAANLEGGSRGGVELEITRENPGRVIYTVRPVTPARQ
ncbi:MAG: hypothetical protein FJW37_12430 [Acidobacteria bacterium]|nr:hypothetical protein [Acidobacteriota bacterium]